MKRTLIFDDTGNAWDSESFQFRLSLDYPAGDIDLADYCVRNLGFVAISMTDRSDVRIRLRPQVAHPSAANSALYWLGDIGPSRVAISTIGENQQDLLFGNYEEAAKTICRWLEIVDFAEDFKRFQKTTVPIEQIKEDANLAALLERWRQSGKTYQKSYFKELLDGPMRGRFAVVNCQPLQMFFEEVGQGFIATDCRWARLASGLRIQDHHDYGYGNWVGEAYSALLKGGDPILEDVDATITRPRLGAMRVKYRRLLLPCQSSAEGSHLLSASVGRGGFTLGG